MLRNQYTIEPVRHLDLYHNEAAAMFLVHFYKHNTAHSQGVNA